jgi:hypothetical protein
MTCRLQVKRHNQYGKHRRRSRGFPLALWLGPCSAWMPEFCEDCSVLGDRRRRTSVLCRFLQGRQTGSPSLSLIGLTVDVSTSGQLIEACPPTTHDCAAFGETIGGRVPSLDTICANNAAATTLLFRSTELRFLRFPRCPRLLSPFALPRAEAGLRLRVDDSVRAGVSI